MVGQCATRKSDGNASFKLQNVLDFIQWQEACLPDSLPRHLHGEITVTISTTIWDLKPRFYAGYDTHCSKTAQRVAYWLTGTDQYLPDILRRGSSLDSWVFDDESCSHQMQLLVFDIIEHKFVLVVGVGATEFVLLHSNLNHPKFSLSDCIKTPVVMTRDQFSNMLHVLQQRDWCSRKELYSIFGCDLSPYNPKNAMVTQLSVRPEGEIKIE